MEQLSNAGLDKLNTTICGSISTELLRCSESIDSFNEFISRVLEFVLDAMTLLRILVM